MLPLFRELARYGAVFIEAYDKRWWVACEVRIPGSDYKNYVKLNGEKLYNVLRDLIPLVKKEYAELIKSTKSPKQSEFQYGLESDYKEMIF